MGGDFLAEFYRLRISAATSGVIPQGAVADFMCIPPNLSKLVVT